MSTTGKKRSRPRPSAKFDPGGGIGRTALVQSHVSEAAAKQLRELAQASAISTAAYIRRVLYVHLGIIKESTDGPVR